MCPTGERLTVHNLSHHTGSTLVGSMFSATTSQLSQDPYHIRVFFQDSTDIQIYMYIYIYHMHLIYLHTPYIYMYIYMHLIYLHTHMLHNTVPGTDALLRNMLTKLGDCCLGTMIQTTAAVPGTVWCTTVWIWLQSWGILFGHDNLNDNNHLRDCVLPPYE